MNVTAWYSLFLNKPVFQENKVYNFKIYVFSFWNTKQMMVFFQTRLGKILIWQKFSGTWESDFKFWYHIKFMCRKAGQKISALARLRNYLNNAQKFLLAKSFIKSQFSYCPLLWMVCSRSLNSLFKSDLCRCVQVNLQG